MSIKKQELEKIETDLDFLVFVVYGGEDDIRYVVFPSNWLKEITKSIDRRGSIEKNYTLRIKYDDQKITYEPKNLDVSEDTKDISRLVDDK